jgi:hypothetical protein
MPTVEEAQEEVARAQAALDEANKHAALAAEASARPRPVGSIMLDIMRQLISRAGNHPDLEKLEKELKAATEQTEQQ